MIRPSQIIGTGYMYRWYIIPRNKFFNIYLHKFIGSDDDRALHDHPWASFSICLKGVLYELTPAVAALGYDCSRITAGKMRYRPATYAHRLMLGSESAWTLFLTGPKIRSWGFLCPKGWQHWSTMTTSDGKKIGGCE